MTIEENKLFKYNSSDIYYNDKCYPYTTEFGTDINLNDRRNEYINNSMSLCEKNCDYEGYNNVTKLVKCKCDIKMSIKSIFEISIDNDKLLHKFIYLKEYINIEIIKCAKNLFKKNGLKYNIGSYILLGIIGYYILALFFFILKGYNFFFNSNRKKNKFRKRKKRQRR